ncbi:MAG: hypothetical protein ACK56F_28860, partial [bacterium]
DAPPPIPDLFTTLTANAAYITTHYADWDLYSGIVLGLQQNPSNLQSPCITSFGVVQTQVNGLPAYI